MDTVKLRIDTKNNRMCIHREGLKAIGDPLYLHFGYHPGRLNLAVIGMWVNDYKAVRVRYDKSGSVYVYSKPLIVGIQKASHILTEPGSYLVEGEIRGGILLFPLAKAKFSSKGGSHEESDGQS